MILPSLLVHWYGQGGMGLIKMTGYNLTERIRRLRDDVERGRYDANTRGLSEEPDVVGGVRQIVSQAEMERARVAMSFTADYTNLNILICKAIGGRDVLREELIKIKKLYDERINKYEDGTA